VSRFSQAISEGDGISVIPVLEGDVRRLAALAEAAGAEAVAVWGPADVAGARSKTALPVLLRSPELELGERGDLRLLNPPDADACVLVYERWADYEHLEHLHARLLDEDVDCVVDVRNEDELEQALERLDPEILLISERDRDRDEDDLERTLDLLPDVPAGKLVISDAHVMAREQALALERAGVDAIVARALAAEREFAQAVEELVGTRPRR
jgi:indole-3-glycerol phosphate synthase